MKNPLPILPLFAASVDLRKHPVSGLKKHKQTEYFAALSYVVSQLLKQLPDVYGIYSAERLKQYGECLSAGADKIAAENDNNKKCAEKILKSPWRKQQRFMLMCDAALIFLDSQTIRQTVHLIKDTFAKQNAFQKTVQLFMNAFNSKKSQTELDTLEALLFGETTDFKEYSAIEGLAAQYRSNAAFAKLPERKFVVTANTSAGKSTLINALIGKPVVKTSQERCTGNLCRIYGKPFEDGRVHLNLQNLTLDAGGKELAEIIWNTEISYAAYFSSVLPFETQRVCITDTPGVDDASQGHQHRDITQKALAELEYDKLIYVINPTNLGSDSEISYMKWIAEKIPKEKIIFVLNKLDEYKRCEDDIEESIIGLHGDLKKLGFEKPVVCPVSARFALLLKMKTAGIELSDEEQEEYDRFAKKFSRNFYDLSKYNEGVKCEPSDSEVSLLIKKSGLYGLEKTIYGGGEQ